MAQTTSDYCTSTCFTIPNDVLLDCDRIKLDIIRRTYKLMLLDAIKSPAYHTPSRKSISDTKGSLNDRGATDKLAALTSGEHNIKGLKKGSQKCFKKVIQEHSLFLRDVRDLRFNKKEG